MAFALTPEREQQVDDLLTRYPTARAALIPVLWVCQRQHGWVSPEVIAWVAERLEISSAAVKGVVTFYTMFHQEEVGENVVWVCRTLSCDLRGGKRVQDHLEERFGCHAPGTSADGKFTLKKAECLAACGQGPMVQIGDRYYENLSLDKLDEILDSYVELGPEKAEARHANTAIYNGHVPPPGMEAPPEPTARASVAPAAKPKSVAPPAAKPASVAPAAKPASVAPPAAKPASVAPPAAKPASVAPPAAKPASVAPAAPSETVADSAPKPKPKPKPKATLLGIPAASPTKPETAAPAADTDAEGEE